LLPILTTLASSPSSAPARPPFRSPRKR
jgi:hypothetical protein